jgi:predicted deacylase
MNRTPLLRKSKPYRPILSACLLSLCIIAICVLVGIQFRDMHHPDIFFPSEGLTAKTRLSDYLADLKNSPGDSDIYVYEGQPEEQGGRILILGGSHPNEPAGMVSAVALLENIGVRRGTVFILPQANLSGFSHNDPFEGNPQYFGIKTTDGIRRFRFGSRLTNPIHQWPDPVLHINPAGQKLAGMESRNLNRSYPGKPKGSLTEKIAFAITSIIQVEKIDIAIDLHEAAPEYPVINAIVFHENSAELAATALMDLQLDGFDISLEASPPNLRGLSHREWGDTTGALSILMETANVSHGRLKGKPSEDLITEGQDPNYIKASRLGLLFVPFDEKGIPLKRRVGRHLAAMRAIINGFSLLFPEKPIEITNFPDPMRIIQEGIGTFLHPPN